VRKFHRWLATIAMVFLLYVSISGSVLAVSELLRGGPHLIEPPGDSERAAAPPAGAPGEGGGDMPRKPPPRFDASGWPSNQFLQEIHSGEIFGVTGQWIDVFVGLFFVALSITGPIMYFQMLRTRRRSGRRQWFWR
jgi:uncharacterized iron-regulated membrane protein